MGLRQFSLVAQFGDLNMMKTGNDSELYLNNYQINLKQGDEARISKIEYTWKQYENQENILIFYRFKFLDANDKELGTL